MLGRKRKPGIGGTAASGLLLDPEIRSAAAHAAQPVARLGVGVGKRFARRRARRRWEQTSETLAALGTLLTTFGPRLAQELGLIETPKRRPIAPVLVTGAALGAGALYLADGDHRHKVGQLIAH